MLLEEMFREVYFDCQVTPLPLGSKELKYIIIAHSLPSFLPSPVPSLLLPLSLSLPASLRFFFLPLSIHPSNNY